MAYSADTFVADEQPTTAKWNKLWTNDASFNDGTGIATGAITSAKISGFDYSLATTNSNPYKFRARKMNAQSPTAATFTKITWDTEDFDTNANFDNVTNFRYTAPVTGYYQIHGRISIGSGATQRFLMCLYKNGAIYSRGSDSSYNGFPIGSALADNIALTATDYIEMWCYAQISTAFENTLDTSLFGAYLTSRT